MSTRHHVSTVDSAPAKGIDVDQVVQEEEKVLARVLRTVDSKRLETVKVRQNYDSQLIALRDQINEARIEDVPPLIEEMERLQAVASRREQVVDGWVDGASPYFGRMVLEENDRRREVLIGRSTFLDSRTGVRIVDWRDAPVSRLYYRFEEGDDYEEEFGGREVEGEILVRRNLTIAESELRRISTPQGQLLKSSKGWRALDQDASRLTGGQGSAMRAESHHRPQNYSHHSDRSGSGDRHQRQGRLGIGHDGGGREEKFLPEIAALIDPRQFELITARDSGLVVIQGGAGSGKTTIGLHRMAYLAYQDRRRFTSDRMLVMVFNDALARYISRVLPALGVAGVMVTTFARWAHRLRVSHVPNLPTTYEEDTPVTVTRMKKSPAMLRLVDAYVRQMEARVRVWLEEACASVSGGETSARAVLEHWDKNAGAPLGIQLYRLSQWMGSDASRSQVGGAHKLAVQRALEKGRALTTDLVGTWAELLTDRGQLEQVFSKHLPNEFSQAEFDEFHRWCVRRCAEVTAFHEYTTTGEEENAEEDESLEGVDGVSERPVAMLDPEDDTLLLRLVQALQGQLRRRKEPLSYEHVFVDEAQDMSPMELGVVLGTASKRQSITLAGDVAQRLHMDNGFSDWNTVLKDLGLDHVQVEPLKLTYRSTAEIIEFSNDVLGPLQNEHPGEATRHGAPVELFQFTHNGEAVAFLGEALRALVQAEPLASVAVVSRYSEQADTYFAGLRNAEVPNLRRVADQDFKFKPGVDVTDVRQVKGLEFDYVVLVEVSEASYPVQDEARHLLHIAATRAAHQLWISSTGKPSPLLPQVLREQS